MRALGLIKDTIMQVDGLVNEHEKAQRLRDIASRTEPKSLGRTKDGRVFRREDLLRPARKLLHEGTVHCRTSSGRPKGSITQSGKLHFLRDFCVHWNKC